MKQEGVGERGRTDGEMDEGGRKGGRKGGSDCQCGRKGREGLIL